MQLIKRVCRWWANAPYSSRAKFCRTTLRMHRLQQFVIRVTLISLRFASYQFPNRHI